MAAKTKFNFIR